MHMFIFPSTPLAIFPDLFVVGLILAPNDGLLNRLCVLAAALFYVGHSAYDAEFYADDSVHVYHAIVNVSRTIR